MSYVETSAETNLITKSQMTRVREIDFVERFGQFSLKKLNEALGVTRLIPMQDGTTMYVYKTTGTLQSGSVGEGEIIPLSQYERTKTAIGTITPSKWRKATSFEAINKSGYDEAVSETDKKMMQVYMESGFANETTFFRAFKAQTGLTPNEWKSGPNKP